MTADTEHSLRAYQRIAPFYDMLDLPFELARYRSIRPLLFEGLSGRLLDAGVGTGRNIAFYPPASQVVGIDLSPAMLSRAARRLKQAAPNVRLLEMNLTELAFADGYFDAAVESFVFCTMPAEVRLAALRELRRVVKPGGRIRLLEYAPAQTRSGRLMARFWQPWAEWAFAARLEHDIELELSEASLTVTASRYVARSIKLVEVAPSA